MVSIVPPPIESKTWSELNLSHYSYWDIPDADTLEQLSGILDPVDPDQVVHSYGPFVDFLVQQKIKPFFNRTLSSTFIVGISGSVVSGKTTVARVLGHLLGKLFGGDRVSILGLDNFLLSNEQISIDSDMARKGFPETFNFVDALTCLQAISKGSAVSCREYDHQTYDIRTDRLFHIEANQKIVIVEGIIAGQDTPENQLAQKSKVVVEGRLKSHIREYCHYGIFVEPETDALLESWFCQRLWHYALSAQQHREGHLYQRYQSIFQRYGDQLPLLVKHIERDAEMIWNTINWPNYIDNIKPTQPHFTAKFVKADNHNIGSILLRTP